MTLSSIQELWDKTRSLSWQQKKPFFVIQWLLAVDIISALHHHLASTQSQNSILREKPYGLRREIQMWGH